MYARSVLAAALLCASSAAADFFGPAFNVPGVDKKGQSVAINNGLKLIKGDYLVWPDADDFYKADDTI